MLFRTYIPAAPLCAFVDNFWLYEDYVGALPRERILPTGTFEMVFNLREDELRIYGPGDPNQCRRYSGALVSGPYAGSFMSDSDEETAVLGVHFRPGGARALLGLPADELANAHIDLRTLWGSNGATLHARLSEVRGPIQRFRLLERELNARLADPVARHDAIRAGLAMLIGSQGQARVRDVAKAVDLSQRRFTALFTAEVGMTPKLFGRVQRFQHAVALSHTTAKVDWAQLAVACGYFDQSHLIHEFAEFSGGSPGDFWARRSRLDQAGIHLKRHHLPLDL